MKFFKLKKKQLLAKYLKELSNYKLKERSIDTNRINTVAVLIENNQSFQRDVVGDISRQFQISREKITCFVFKEFSKKDNLGDEFISQNNFGWSGSLNLNRLGEFVKNDYDLLINYGFEDNLYLKVITLRSQSKFKIGFTTGDEGLYDLAVSDVERNIETLNREADKYLKILKKK